jgi:hypothetical protein
MLQRIIEAFPDEELLSADGFDTAVIGIEANSMKLIYSTQKILEILMEDMNAEDAIEYFEFNIKCAYVGEKTPIYCDDDF